MQTPQQPGSVAGQQGANAPGATPATPPANQPGPAASAPGNTGRPQPSGPATPQAAPAQPEKAGTSTPRDNQPGPQTPGDAARSQVTPGANKPELTNKPGAAKELSQQLSAAQPASAKEQPASKQPQVQESSANKSFGQQLPAQPSAKQGDTQPAAGAAKQDEGPRVPTDAKRQPAKNQEVSTKKDESRLPADPSKEPDSSPQRSTTPGQPSAQVAESGKEAVKNAIPAPETDKNQQPSGKAPGESNPPAPTTAAAQQQSGQAEKRSSASAEPGAKDETRSNDATQLRDAQPSPGAYKASRPAQPEAKTEESAPAARKDDGPAEKSASASKPAEQEAAGEATRPENSGGWFGKVRDGLGSAASKAGNAISDGLSRAAELVTGKSGTPEKSSTSQADAERRQGEQAAAMQGAERTPAQATPPSTGVDAGKQVEGVDKPGSSSPAAPVHTTPLTSSAAKQTDNAKQSDGARQTDNAKETDAAKPTEKKEAGFVSRFLKANGAKLQDRVGNNTEAQTKSESKEQAPKKAESKKSDGLLGSLRDKANDVKDGLGDAAKNFGDKANDIKDGLGNAAKNVGDKAKDAVGDAAKKLGDKAGEVKGAVGDTAKKVGDKASDVKDAVTDKVKDGVEKVDGVKDAAADKLKDEAKKTKDAGADVLDKARDTAGEQLSKAGETIGGPIGTAIDNLGREVQGEQNRQNDRDEAIDDLSRNLSPEQRDKVERALKNDRLDADILKDIAMDKSSIESVKNDDPRLRDENGNPRAGFYDADTDKIYIAENTFKDQDKLDKVLYDEIGHRIDDRLRENRATSNGWSDMVENGLREERQNPRLDENARKNREEFASEAISDYLRGGDQAERLREAHPELFQTIRQTVGEGDRGRVADWKDAIGALSPLSGRDSERFRRNQLSGIHHSDSPLDRDRGPRQDRDDRQGRDRSDRPQVDDRPAQPARPAAKRPADDQAAPAVRGDQSPPAKTTPDDTSAGKSNSQPAPANGQGTTTPRADGQGTTTPRTEGQGTTTPRSDGQGNTNQPSGFTPLSLTGNAPNATLASFTNPAIDPLLGADNQQPRTPPVEPQGFRGDDQGKPGDGTANPGNDGANSSTEPDKSGPAGNQTGKPADPGATTPAPAGRQDPPAGRQDPPAGRQDPPAGRQDPPGTQPVTQPTGARPSAAPDGQGGPTSAPSGTPAPARPTQPSGQGTPTTAPGGTQPPARSTQPTGQQPAPQQPAPTQPAYQQPAPQQPTYQQPTYQQPAYQQPARGGGGYGGGGYSYGYAAPAAFSPAMNPLSSMLNSAMMPNDFGASLLQGSLGDMTQLNQLGMAQQELMKLDQSLLQNPALGELEKISQGLLGLDKLPQALQGLEQLKDIAPALEKMPQTLDGLNNVQRMMDKVKDLPASAKDLSRSPELRQMMRDLPQTNQKLQGLTELAKSGPQLPGQLQGLQQVKQVGETLQTIGQQAEKLNQLPSKLDQVAQAVPALRAGSAESNEPLTKADGRPNTGTRVEIAQGGQVRQRLEAPVRTDRQGDSRGEGRGQQQPPRTEQQPMPRDNRDPQRRPEPNSGGRQSAPIGRPEARPPLNAPPALRPDVAGPRPEGGAVRPEANRPTARPGELVPPASNKLATPPATADKMLLGKQPGADNLPVPGRDTRPPIVNDKAPFLRQPAPPAGAPKPPATPDRMPIAGAPKPPATPDKMPLAGAPRPPATPDKMPLAGAPKPPATPDKMPLAGAPRPPAAPDKMPIAGAPRPPAAPDKMPIAGAPKPPATLDRMPIAGAPKPPGTPDRMPIAGRPPVAASPIGASDRPPLSPGKPAITSEQPVRPPLNPPAKSAGAPRPAGPAVAQPGKSVPSVSVSGPVARPPLVAPGRAEVPAVRSPIETPVAKAPPAADVKVPWMEHGPRADAPVKARPHREVTSTGGPAPQVRVQKVNRPASTSEIGQVDTRVSQRLQKAPVMARKLEQLPQAQKQLNQAVSGLEKATRPDNMRALQKTVADPNSLSSGLDRLSKLVTSPEDKAALAGLRKTLEPVIGDPNTRKGLQQVNNALKPLGRQELHALRNVKLDTAGTRQMVQQLTQPSTRQQVERVSNGLSNAQELQKATQAQQARLAAKPETSAPADLSDSVAKIVQDAQAANRPRSLFGIQLGGGAARGGAGVAPAGGMPAAPNPVRGAAPAARPGVAPVNQQIQPAAPKPANTQPAVQPQPQPAAAPAQAPKPQAPGAREALSKPRLDAYRQSYDIMRDQMIGKAGKDHAWAMVYHTRDAEGAKGVADTLESTVTKGGSAKMQSWLNDMTKNPDSATALSAILANVGTATPDRMVGILLLTTDGEGGKETVANAFNKMSSNVDSSLRLAHFLEVTSRHPNAGRGVAELLDGMTEPKGESWHGATQASQTFKNISETVGGSRRLTQTLENLGELEGGNRLVARTLNRMARTGEGAQNTLETLQNLAHDKEGAGQLGKVLSRASESRDGARDILGSLQKMSAKPAGQQDVGRLLVRLAEGGQGARLLANWAKDGNNAGHLTQLFDQLGQNNESRQLLGHALDIMAKNPRQRAQYEVFAGRAAMSDSLQAAIDYATKSEVRSALGGSESASPSSSKSRWDESEEPAELKALRHQPQRVMEMGEVAESQQQLRKASDLAGVSEVWRSERAAVTSEAASLSTTQATPIPERLAEQPPEPKSFRPGDVYSQETLRHARICPECGGRTTSLGWCPGCSARQQQKQAQATTSV